MQLFEHIDKKVVMGFGIVLVLALGFMFFSMGNKSGPVSASTSPISAISGAAPIEASLGQDLLVALAKLDSTKLDTSIFSDPVFSSLKDFGVEIASQPVGRRNPFALFGGVSRPSTPTSPASKTPAKGSGNSVKLPATGKTPPAASTTPATPKTTPKTPVIDPNAFD